MRILQSMLTALVSAPTRIGVLSWLQDKGIDDTPEGLAGAVLGKALGVLLCRVQ